MTDISRFRALRVVASALLLTGCGKEPTPTSKLAQSPTPSDAHPGARRYRACIRSKESDCTLIMRKFNKMVC